MVLATRIDTAWFAGEVILGVASRGNKMNNFKISAIALAFGFAFSAGAIAQNLSKEDYKSDKTAIGADYKSDKAGCNAFSGNAKDICAAQAKGKENVALAELAARYKPSNEARHDVQVAIAEAAYAVADERCDDKAGNVKDVCVKEAKAARTIARADAKAQMKTADANAEANEKSADARHEASDKAVDAQQAAAVSKLDAEYVLAREKCDTYASSAKDACLHQVKARFGKS